MWVSLVVAMAAVATADLPTLPPLPSAAVKEAAADVGDAVPTVPPLPDALPTAGEAATAITDALPTVEPEEDTSITGQVSSKLSDIHKNVQQVFSLGDDNNSGKPPFIIALVLVVAAALSLRVFAHYSFNDHNNAVREEKNRKAKSNAAEKEAQRQDAEEAAWPVPAAPGPAAMPVMGQPQMLMGSGVYQQPMVVSGYQAQTASPTVSGVTYAPMGTQPYVIQQ